PGSRRFHHGHGKTARWRYPTIPWIYRPASARLRGQARRRASPPTWRFAPWAAKAGGRGWSRREVRPILAKGPVDLSSAERRSRLFIWKIQPDFPVMLGLFRPVLAHLHEQEQVNAPAQQFLQLGARQFADLLDGRAALAQHDRLLAVALDIDHLVDADRSVLALLPLLGFDRA